MVIDRIINKKSKILQIIEKNGNNCLNLYLAKCFISGAKVIFNIY